MPETIARLCMLKDSTGYSLQQAALINTKGLGTKYFVEYTVTKPSQAQRHLLSLVALGNNGTCVYSGTHSFAVVLLEYCITLQQQDLCSCKANFEIKRGQNLCKCEVSCRHNKLYTATAQCREEQLTTWRPVLQTVLESFKPPHQDK